MFGSIRDMQDGSREEVIALVIENHEALAALDINRFFAMQMLAGVPTNRDLCPHKTAAASWKSQFGGNHQSRLVILTRSHPREILRSHYARRGVDKFVVFFGSLQPLTIKITHEASLFVRNVDLKTT